VVTVITKTIGPTGRDYTTFTLAEADVTNIGTSADLVANDEAIVFEADAGTYTTPLSANSTLVTDATRNVTYKPAAGSEHGGSAGAGVIIDTGGSNRPITLTDDFTVVDGFNLVTTTTYCAWLEGAGAVAQNCIASAANRGFVVYGGTAANPVRVLNCVSRGGSSVAFYVLADTSSDAYGEIINCTGDSTTTYPFLNQQTANTASGTFINCLSLASQSFYNAGGTVSGSNNFGPATNPFPAALQGSPYPITATTSFSTPLGSGDYAVYMGATGALADVTGNDVWQQGVGPGSNSDVPTTDINGVARSGASCNPGAFEADGFVEPTVITRTIDASGAGDYTTFALALADIASVAGGSDLTLLNRAVVFEAVAGNYGGVVNVDSTSFEFDPTRNLTLRPQAGSEHGGDRNAGVIVAGGSSYAFRMPCDFLRIEGFVCTFTGSYGVLLLGSHPGVLVDGLIVDDLNSATMAIRNDGAGATADFPVVIQNCVVFVQGSRGIGFFGSGTYHARVTNCTVVHSAVEWCYINYNPSATLEFTNNVALTSGSTFRDNSGTATITGSNNFGSGTNPFPAALQGSPYPITAVTDPEQPAAGDYAIHDAQGRLYDTSRNDVLQAGVGPSANSDVPTTDITGEARSGATCNPGAFEATVVLSISTPAAGALNNSPDFRVHLDRRVTDASFGVSAVYDSASDSTTFTLPYRLNAYARMQVVTRKTSGANAGELLSVTATDANAGTVTVAGNHTSTAVFIGETYIMKYEFSTPHLQAQQRMSPTKGASHRIRYGTVTFADTSFFEVKVKPKGGDAYTYTFNGNLLNEPETLLGQVVVYDGDFKFPVMADHDRATVTLENDSPLPSRFLGCEWEAFYHSRIGQRSRF
jgi:hypothetical protein